MDCHPAWNGPSGSASRQVGNVKRDGKLENQVNDLKKCRVRGDPRDGCRSRPCGPGARLTRRPSGRWCARQTGRCGWLGRIGQRRNPGKTAVLAGPCGTRNASRGWILPGHRGPTQKKTTIARYRFSLFLVFRSLVNPVFFGVGPRWPGRIHPRLAFRVPHGPASTAVFPGFRRCPILPSQPHRPVCRAHHRPDGRRVSRAPGPHGRERHPSLGSPHCNIFSRSLT